MLLRRSLEALHCARAAEISSPSRLASLPRRRVATKAPELRTMRVQSSSSPTPPTTTSSAAPPPPPPPAAAAAVLPTTYRRLVARVPSPSFRSGAQIQEVPLPPESKLEEGQAVVKIAVAGVNGGCETFRVRAEPGSPFEKKTPSSSDLVVPLGAEGAGTVVAVGPGVRPSQLSIGDRVTVSGGSAFAEFVVVAARGCFKVPTTPPSSLSPSSPPLSPAAAVALSLSGLTAAVALHATARVRSGETVLVTAAAGGTGHLAVQLAALAGCRVVAVAGGARKARRLRAELSRLDPRGEMRHAVVDYRACSDLSSAISEALLGGGGGIGDEGEKVKDSDGIDVCYEGVGGEIRKAVLRNLSPGARVLCVGYMSSYPHTDSYSEKKKKSEGAEEGTETETETVFVSGPFDAKPRGEASLPLEPELFWSRRVVSLPDDSKIYGDVWSGAAGDPRTLARLRKNLFAAALRGELVPWIDGEKEVGEEEENEPSSPSFSGLEAASDAVERLLSGESMGKVVLRVSGDGAW